MCNFFKIYPSPRISRRKRKYLALLSLTSGGLTMLLMAHSTVVISPLETPIFPFVPATNDTPVDYFMAHNGPPTEETDEAGVEYPTQNSESQVFRKFLNFKGRVDKTTHDDIRSNRIESRYFVPTDQSTYGKATFPVGIPSTKSASMCCKEDFHQNPYVTEPLLTSRFNSRNVEFFLSTSDKRSFPSPKRLRKLKSNYKNNLLNKRIRTKNRKSDSEKFKKKKENYSSHHRKEKEKNIVLKKRNTKSRLPTLRNASVRDALSNGNNQEEKPISMNPNKYIHKSPIQNLMRDTTPISTIEVFPMEYLEDKKELYEQQRREDETSFEDNASIIDIPEVTFNNVSFVLLKKQKIKEILDKIDIGKIFTSTSYKNKILSGDLSQWSDLLSLPEDNIQNTYEPNKILENFEYRTGRPGSTESSGDEKLISKIARDKPDFGYLRIKNNFPNELLRDLPRQRIRKSFHIRPREEDNSLIRGQNLLPSEHKGKTGSQNYFLDSGPSTDYRNVMYPFHFDYTRPAYFPWRSTKDECSNHATRFLLGGTGKIVPLASFPGSGNTWLRYISETLTGIFTGSLYEDDILAIRGFWGERDSYIEGTTLLQKTHSFPVLPSEVTEWDGRMILAPGPRKILLLIRSPYDALVSLRHFHAAGHTGFGHHAAFSGASWDNFTEERTDLWLRLNKAWLELPNSKILVIHYEMLMQNLENDAKRLLRFLGIPLDYGRLSCLQRYPEGKFRRPRYPKHLQGYQISRKTASLLASAVTSLNQILASHDHPTLPTQLYSYHPPTKAPSETDTQNNLSND